MKKILTVCSNGLGSSMLLKMNIDKVVKEQGWEADVKNTDLSSAKSTSVDLYVGSKEILSSLEGNDRVLVPIKNLMDKEELKNSLSPFFA